MRELDSVGLFVDILKLCRVAEGEFVVVLSQGDRYQERAEAFMRACHTLGARAVNVRLSDERQVAADGTFEPISEMAAGSGVFVSAAGTVDDNRRLVDLLKSADVLIDLVFLLYTRAQLEISAAGTRTLVCIEPLPVLERLVPTADLRRRVDRGAELLGAASKLRFTNALGTDVTYTLGAYPAYGISGFPDRPGGWDHWPSGFVFGGAGDTDVDGRVVIAPGDVILPFNTYVRDAIDVTIEAGRIVGLDGGVDAAVVREYLEGFDDPRGFAISHIGWGMNEKSKWSTLATAGPNALGMETRGYEGNVLFSTGPNLEIGGSNDTKAHLDIPMRNCSLWLDDRQIIDAGRIVVPELQS